MKKRVDYKVLILSFAIVFSIAFIGSIFTSGNTDSEWFNSIKPSITPPNYVFPIVWNIIFALIALSLYFAWTNSSKKQKKKIALVFGINLILNALWSFLYFGIQNPGFALIEIFFLWLSIILMLILTFKIKKLSFYFLIPYLLWVSFAIFLNFLSWRNSLLI
jgi:translocator protein